jgi:farnesyl diphosphate synthase
MTGTPHMDQQRKERAERAKTALADFSKRFNPRFSKLLDDALKGAPDRISAATRHGALNGGKRLRPYLVEATAQLFGDAPQAAALAATALECVHCYSLVHDDLPAMDNDDLRRGQPTVHISFDEATAILAGDTLLTLAFEFTAKIDPAAMARDMALSLARASGALGMIGGQMLDLEAEGRFADGLPQHHDTGTIRTLQAMKTGALIRTACTMGAIAGSATAAQTASLEVYGSHLGFAFQIADDLLDHRGDSAALGKAAGKDAAAGKATLVGLMGVDAAEARLAQTIKAACAELEGFGKVASPLTDLAHFVAGRNA